ncbi:MULTISPECIES: hypothetical protein [unclassified Vibrio]|uniref:hypothetical protein n=1 Tax=unclassified Vibrio TaxID=2614977 RepID=UPI0018D42EF1|nr:MULTISPECIES: hypothetical protein [unclassified Vibrio]
MQLSEILKVNRVDERNKQAQERAKTIPKFLVFYGIFSAWCAIVVYSTMSH